MPFPRSGASCAGDQAPPPWRCAAVRTRVLALKAHAPQAQIDALVYAETADMLTGHPAINTVHVIDPAWKTLGTLPPRRRMGLVRQLKAQRYDLIVHSRKTGAAPGSAACARHAGAWRRRPAAAAACGRTVSAISSRRRAAIRATRWNQSRRPCVAWVCNRPPRSAG